MKETRVTPERASQLAVVVPCHNEEESLPQTAAVLRALLTNLRQLNLVSDTSYVCFIDDGSKDSTWQIISALSSEMGDVRGIKLSRNFGHQGAVLAGMLECEGDAIVTIDADLQDDEGCIRTMMEKYSEGYDVVLGVRENRDSDSFFKRASAQGYYRLLKFMKVQVVFNHADYRLLSRRAIELLGAFQESNIFLRGLIPLVGLPSVVVGYVRRERFAGESKYPLSKMLALAWEGVTSFSIFPLRTVAAIGLLISFGSLSVTVWALYQKLISGSVIPGWASTVVPMYFLGGIQILCLGVIGEYVGKIYLETKRRPKYLIEQTSGTRR